MNERRNNSVGSSLINSITNTSYTDKFLKLVFLVWNNLHEQELYSLDYRVISSTVSNDNDNDFLTKWNESDKKYLIWGDEMRK